MPEFLQIVDLDKAISADILKKAQTRAWQPPWLKDYVRQFEDPAYIELTLAERGLLKDLRLLALRIGNKIPCDDRYLRQQLRLGPRTRVAPKLSRLRELGLLEPYNEATEIPAITTVLSAHGLEHGENGKAQEVEVERTRAGKEGTGEPRRRLRAVEKSRPVKQRSSVNGPHQWQPGHPLRFIAIARPLWEEHGEAPPSERVAAVRIHLEGFTDNPEEIAAHLRSLGAASDVS